MANWTYKGEKYESQKIDWEEIYNNTSETIEEELDKKYKNIATKDGYTLVYVPKQDRCYTLKEIKISGNTATFNATLEDVYTHQKYITSLKNVEIVLKSKVKHFIGELLTFPQDIAEELNKVLNKALDYTSIPFKMYFPNCEVSFNTKEANTTKKEMKKFNLEEYKKHPNRKIVDGTGHSVRIVCTDCKGDYPIVTLVSTEGFGKHSIIEFTRSYSSTGEYDFKCDSNYNLYFVTKKVIRYSIYNADENYMYANIYDTKEAAELTIHTFYRNKPCEIIPFEIEVYDTI